MKPVELTAVCASAALVALTLHACQATVEVEAGPGVPLAGGSKLEGPTRFELRWNGQLIADGLEDAVLGQTAGGWWATTVEVPSSLVDYGPVASNEAGYAVETSEGEVTYRLELSVQP